jgi:hypothetical protein
MDTWIIILGIVILVIIWYLVRYYLFSSASLAPYLKLINNPEDISSNVIINPTSILYSFGSWVYVNNFSDAVLFSYVFNGIATPLKHINNTGFMLSIGGINVPANNNINIGIKGTPVLTAMISANANDPTKNTVITISNNFPIQKWVHVLVSVDTTYADCYLDGKLVISTQLKTQITKSPPAVPFITFKQPNASSPPPDILLSKLTRWDHPLDPQSVWNEYYAGNGVKQGGNLSVGLSVAGDTGTNNYPIYSNA